jgi:hypothetical protein
VTLKGQAKLKQHLLIVRIALALAVLHAILGIISFF